MRYLLVAGPLALLVALLGVLWWGQEFLIFQPTRLAAEYRFALPADVHETTIDVPNARLHALHMKLPKPRGIVFYLHGNGGNVADWFVNHELYRTAGYDLFMLDYRGYGKSSGHVTSEAQLLDDVRTAWRTIAPAYAGRKVVFFGRSLGTGLATTLAASLEPALRPDLLVLVSPYRSLPALAGEHYPMFPSALIRYGLRNDEALAALAGPGITVAGNGKAPGGPLSPVRVLMIHGGRDTLIKPDHSEALARSRPDVMRIVIPEAGHNDLQTFDAYHAAIRDALARLAP